MKHDIKILDDYFNNGAKAFVGIFMIWLFFGSLHIFRTPLFLKDLVIGVLCFAGLIFLGTLMFSKKVILIENGAFYQGLIFGSRVFYKKLIDIGNCKALKVYDFTNQVVIPWWISVTANLWTDEKAFTFKLVTQEGSEKYLMSFKGSDSKNDAIDFFKTNTDLIIKHCKK